MKTPEFTAGLQFQHTIIVVNVINFQHGKESCPVVRGSRASLLNKLCRKHFLESLFEVSLDVIDVLQPQ